MLSFEIRGSWIAALLLQPVEPLAAAASKCDYKVRIAELEATVRSQGRAIEEMRSLAARMEEGYGQRRAL